MSLLAPPPCPVATILPEQQRALLCRREMQPGCRLLQFRRPAMGDMQRWVSARHPVSACRTVVLQFSARIIPAQGVLLSAWPPHSPPYPIHPPTHSNPQPCAGEHPVRGRNRDLQAPEDCPQGVIDLCKACTSKDPAARPTAKELVERLTVLARITPPMARRPAVAAAPAALAAEEAGGGLRGAVAAAVAADAAGGG